MPASQPKNCWFEEQANISNLDNPYNSKILDSSTTVEGLIKTLAEDYIYKENALEGIKYAKGQILRVVKLSENDSDYRNYAFSIKAALKSKGGTIDAYIVRVPMIHSMLIAPKSYGTEKFQEYDAGLINLHKPYFISSDNTSYGLGDFVEVAFGNTVDYSDARIVNSFSSVPQGNSTSSPGTPPPSIVEKGLFKGDPNAKYGPGRRNEKPKSAFQGKPDEGVDPKDPEVFLSKGDAWKGGGNIGKIKLKKIGENNKNDGSPHAIAANAADDFNKMYEQFKKENPGRRIKINESWRSEEDQKKLQNNPGAAKVNSSPHQTGIAVDLSTIDGAKVINTSVEKYNTDVYDWLWKNGNKYNIYNFGKYYVSDGVPNGEPWHWEHIPKDQERAKEFINLNPSVLNNKDV